MNSCITTLILEDYITQVDRKVGAKKLENPSVIGGTVVKVLCYKSEGRWFDPSWCQWIFH